MSFINKDNIYYIPLIALPSFGLIFGTVNYFRTGYIMPPSYDRDADKLTSAILNEYIKPKIKPLDAEGERANNDHYNNKYRNENYGGKSYEEFLSEWTRKKNEIFKVADPIQDKIEKLGEEIFRSESLEESEKLQNERYKLASQLLGNNAYNYPKIPTPYIKEQKITSEPAKALTPVEQIQEDIIPPKPSYPKPIKQENYNQTSIGGKKRSTKTSRKSLKNKSLKQELKELKKIIIKLQEKA